MKKLRENKKTKSDGKAGVIPYILQDGVIKMMFMQTKSNPSTGWQIAKGGIKKEETKKVAAFREASEEIGLFKPNCKNIKNVGSFGGITLFITEIVDLNQFGDPSENDTKSVSWLTLDEFEESGRTSQKHIVKQVHEIINNHKKVS